MRISVFGQLIVPETDKDKAAPKVLYMRVITPGTQGDDFGVYARAIEEKVSFVLYWSLVYCTRSLLIATEDAPCRSIRLLLAHNHPREHGWSLPTPQ